MVINSFLIEGISNISSLRLDLGQLNALIAPNGYGKSNVLSAVEFGMKFLSATPQEKLQMMRSRFVPINSGMLGKDFTALKSPASLMERSKMSNFAGDLNG